MATKQILSGATGNTTGSAVSLTGAAGNLSTEGVNIMVYGTYDTATVTIQVLAPDGSWVPTDCTFTNVGYKNVLVKVGDVIRAVITGASGTNAISCVAVY